MTDYAQSGEDLYRSLLDALPALVFVVDEQMCFKDYNAAAAEFMGNPDAEIIQMRCGEALHCIHASDMPEGCGAGPRCGECLLRNGVHAAISGTLVHRHRRRLEFSMGGIGREVYAMITVTQFRYRGEPHALLVIEDISDIGAFRRMIPICSVCKKIRDERESWQAVESYFRAQWDIEFSHGLCPHCLEQEMGKMDRDDDMAP